MSIHDTVPGPPKKARESVQRLADGLIAISGQMTGHDNAKTTNVIAELLGIESKGTNQAIREAAKILLNEERIPLISCNKGFYFSPLTKDLRQYRESLNARIKGLARDVRSVDAIIEARQQQANPELDLSLGMDQSPHTEAHHPQNDRTGD